MTTDGDSDLALTRTFFPGFHMMMYGMRSPVFMWNVGSRCSMRLASSECACLFLYTALLSDRVMTSLCISTLCSKSCFMESCMKCSALDGSCSCMRILSDYVRVSLT